jgi:hypothetical protein
MSNDQVMINDQGTTTFRVKEYGMTMEIPTNAEIKIPVETRIQRAIDYIYVSLTAHILTQDLDPIVIKYPSNWKEHLKQRFAPKWFLRRYPVKETVVIITAEAFYPNMVFPKGEHYIRVSKQVEA